MCNTKRAVKGKSKPEKIIGIDEAGRAAHKTSEPRSAFIIGIDEAGRGPLAGPVVVGGVRVSAALTDIFFGIEDSKKLSPKKREEWFAFLTTHPDIHWAVARVRPHLIDRINVAHAANLGAYRVYKKLSQDAGCKVLLDGSLYLPPGVHCMTIIKGDEKIPAISAASIIAKVTRDRIMLRNHKKYPQYRFDAHKGYGTKLHQEKIKEFGYSPEHRRTFRIKGLSK